jgi:hypothetical protein
VANVTKEGPTNIIASCLTFPWVVIASFRAATFFSTNTSFPDADMKESGRNSSGFDRFWRKP